MKNYNLIKPGLRTVLLLLVFPVGNLVLANIPGGGTGTGPDVTVTDNGDGTVTMANGIVSIVVTKSGASIHQIYYAYNNGGGIQTQQVLAGGKDGGEFYWEFGGWGGSSWAYSVVTNSGSYAEIDLLCDSASNGVVDIHYSMLRGSPGFYVTPIWSHRAQDAAMGTGEERDNIYIAPYFNWMSVNDQVQREEGLNATYSPAFYSPQENSLVTSGVLQGTYEDKYKWSADFGVERVWGWSSVSDPAIGLVGKNVGIWHVVASSEFYNGGPLKPELNDAPMVNMINGGHYYFGNDSGFAAGETWTRASGPYFIYFNKVTNTLTDPVQTSQALWADAQAQAAAEAAAWPYSWFNNINYAPASQRGTVTGQIVINDAANPNASASNLWVGVVQQPAVTINNVYDFQLWMKPFQFWTKSDAKGNFVISNVIAGANYTLYAFGPGAEGLFMSKNQTGGNPGIIFNLPSAQFTVVVTGGTTNNLGTVTWTPTRVGPTVFEIGYPDRKGDKFRHGDDYWVGDIGPSPTAPSPVWTKFLELPFDFPNGVNYVVGQNCWNTDWNFIQSVYPDFSGNSVTSSSTVTFNLATAPANGATASLLMGIASDDNSPIYVTVNGTLLSGGNATGTPQTSLPTTGWFPINDISDSNIREENHGGYSDERLTFAGSLLHSGNNTINFSFRQAGGSGFTHHFMYDYLRLELTGYVPPAPASVVAYAGNNAVLLSWPVTPGATSYNILRSTTSGGGYISITNGVVGPVCGSGPANATFVDNSAVNGTTYYYVVQSVNPVSASTNSPESSGVVPSSGIASTAPATPSVVVTGTNNSVTLNWSVVPGADFYTIHRGTVVNKLGFVPLWITLNKTTTAASYTDASGTLGCNYSYIVTATSAGGTSGNSIAVTAKPVPPPPASAPVVSLTANFTSTNQSVFLHWSPLNGAVGYILYRSTNASGPFGFPGNYVMSMSTTNWTDGNLALNTQYYYVVVAMNAGGVSGNSAIVGTPPAPPAAPASLSAIPGDSQVILNWPAFAGATGYYLYRGTSSGNETTTVVANYSGTSYTNTALNNGTTYYFVVAATNAGGLGPNSPEASATPSSNIIVTSRNLTWKGDGVANVWDVSGTANWQTNGVATIFNNGDSVTFDDTGSNNVPVALTGALQPALVTVNASENYTFGGTGLISGTNALVKSGGGTLTLTNTGNNSFTGGVTILGGILAFGTDSGKNENDHAPGTGSILASTNGQLRLGGDAGGTQVQHYFTNAVTLNGGTIFGVDGDQHFTNSTFAIAAGGGTLLGRWPNKDILIESPVSGSGPLTVNYGGGGSPGSTVYFSNPLNSYAGTINVLANSVTLTSPYALSNAVLNVVGTGPNLVWSGIASAVLGGLSGAGNIALGANQLIVGQNGGSTTYSGALSGTGSLVKNGAGAFTLAGTDAFTGSTTVNSGTLLVNGSLNGSSVTVAGGTLSGIGVISGAPVAINSGAAFAPGVPGGYGVLTISNSLALAAGSTSIFGVGQSPLTNSAASISGVATNGGMLIVTNLGGTPLAAGDAFKLLRAASYAGAFSGLTLPRLPFGLAWNTDSLNSAGKISIVPTTLPVFRSVYVTGGDLALSGTGGVGNANYYLLGSTNLSMPVTNWTRLLTNQFDAGGNFNLTNPLNPGSPQKFYLLQLP